jgi:hypothetical protein
LTLPPLHAVALAQAHSYRNISTGSIRAADRAGTSVDAALINRAATTIQKASKMFGSNGTKGTE